MRKYAAAAPVTDIADAASRGLPAAINQGLRERGKGDLRLIRVRGRETRAQRGLGCGVVRPAHSAASGAGS
jgi:hypothetical protein